MVFEALQQQQILIIASLTGNGACRLVPQQAELKRSFAFLAGLHCVALGQAVPHCHIDIPL